MEKQEADRLAAAYLKPIFGFALKRCKNRQDAEDLTQDILLKAFRALRMREDVEDVRAFVWTIAHHALSNYYRDNKQQGIGVSLEEAAGSLCDRGRTSFPISRCGKRRRNCAVKSPICPGCSAAS